MSFKERIIRLAMLVVGSFVITVAAISGWNALTATPVKVEQLSNALDLLGEGLQIIQEALPILSPLV